MPVQESLDEARGGVIHCTCYRSSDQGACLNTTYREPWCQRVVALGDATRTCLWRGVPLKLLTCCHARPQRRRAANCSVNCSAAQSSPDKLLLSSSGAAGCSVRSATQVHATLLLALCLLIIAVTTSQYTGSSDAEGMR